MLDPFTWKAVNNAVWIYSEQDLNNSDTVRALLEDCIDTCVLKGKDNTTLFSQVYQEQEWWEVEGEGSWKLEVGTCNNGEGEKEELFSSLM